MEAGRPYNNFMTIIGAHFSKHKGVIIFSLLKYIEIIVTAFTTFFLAKKLGPHELGHALPILLYITYANYLALGLNQTVTKNLSRVEKVKKVSFVTINMQYLLVISVVNFCLAYLFLDNKYAFFAALISILTIFRGFFSSYFRAINRITVLNVNNIIFSSVLFSLVFLYVSSLCTYLYVWSILLMFSVFSYALFDVAFFKRVLRNLLSTPNRKDLLFNFTEGIKLALTGVVTTIFLTFDRFIINKLDIPLEIKGSYQLADYVGMAIYMVATTIIFYFYPRWISLIREDESFSQYYLKRCTIILLLAPIIIAVVYIVGQVFIPLFFPEYPNLLWIVLCVVYSKLSIVSLSFISLYYIGKDQENNYLRRTFYAVGLILIFAVWGSIVKYENYFLYPLINGTILFTISLITLVQLKKFSTNEYNY